MADDALLVKLYQKVSGCPLFDLKAYLEYTEKVNISSIWKILTYLLVNGLFVVLDMVVGFFSLILSFFEKIDLYGTYKHTVYDMSKKLWQGLLGSGNYTQSIVYALVAIGAFCGFIAYIFSKGDVVRRLLHLFAVLLLGFGYYGTMQNTSGGLYILDSIHNFATSASQTIAQVSLTDPQDSHKQLSSNQSVTDNYVAKTAYAAYLYVNTGRLDGKYYNNQTGQLEDFDDSQVLGKTVNGSFQKVKTADRDKKGGYLDELGTDADEGKEKDRWVSAVFDYLPIKFIYVGLKIIEAIILGIPLVLVQFLGFLAQLVVLFLIAFFPLALILSLIPSLSDTIFNTMKLMGGASIFPAFVGFMTLMVFYMESLIAAFVSTGFGKLSSGDTATFGDYLPAVQLLIQTFLEGVTLVAFWKNKERTLAYLLGHHNARAINQLTDTVANKAQTTLSHPKEMYDNAADTAMMTLGVGTGAAVMAKEHLSNAMSKLKPDYDNIQTDEVSQDYNEDDSNINPMDLSTDTWDTDMPDYDEPAQDANEDMPNLDELLADRHDQEEALGYDEVSPQDEILSEEIPDLANIDYDEVTSNNLDSQDNLEAPEKEVVSQGDVTPDSILDDNLDPIETPDYDTIDLNQAQDDSQSQTVVEALTYQPEEDHLIYDDLSSDSRSAMPQTDTSSAIEDLANRPKASQNPKKRTSKDLPNDYRIYQLEEDLAAYQNAPDLGELQAKTAFERGLKKTLSKQKQYEHNKKRMSHIEQELVRLRGEDHV